MSKFSGLYNIRDIKPEDINFVLATFLRGLYYGDSWFSKIPKQVFMDNYKNVAESLVHKATVKVACLKDDPDVIIGYSILSNDYQTIHYVYVKAAWRKQGIARSILPQYPTTVTHLTTLGNQLITKFKDVIFNPFQL